MIRSRLRFMGWLALAVLLYVLATPGISFAQSDTARLQGTVTDAKDAVVVGGNVKVTNTGTGRETTVATNESGFYPASALPAGHHLVEVSQRGFTQTLHYLQLQDVQ